MENERYSADPAAARLLDRMLYFSDSVFAIVLTLLVLDLRIPAGVTDATLFRAVLNLVPKLVAFGTTFVLVAIFWIAHVSIARRLTAFDWPAAWVNLLFLFTVALTPFVSTMLGEYSVFGNAWRIYCIELTAVGCAQLVLFLVVHRDQGRLIGGVDRPEYWHRFTRAVSPAVAFVILLALSLLGLARISFFLSLVLIPVMLLVARALFARGRKAAKAAP
jgi:uncharacterized membrane protein